MYHLLAYHKPKIEIVTVGTSVHSSHYQLQTFFIPISLTPPLPVARHLYALLTMLNVETTKGIIRLATWICHVYSIESCYASLRTTWDICGVSVTLNIPNPALQCFSSSVRPKYWRSLN